MTKPATMYYTLTDEAPRLATGSLLPILRRFLGTADIEVRTADISLTGRILAQFSDLLGDKKVSDDLKMLGELALQPQANIIKLPNISASVAQLKAAVKELQAAGYPLPDYPDDPKTDAEKDARKRYGACIGSNVNPVLRQGNSDRRAPRAVKEYARQHPHSMGEWVPWSRTHVSHMEHGDFYNDEKSLTTDRARTVKMELITRSGKTLVLKPKIPLEEGEIIDSMFMSKKALLEFYETQMEDAKRAGIMFSLHVKATMMKVSHPIVFGHCIRVFYKDAFAKHQELFDELGVNVNNGMVDLFTKIKQLPKSVQEEIRADLHACHEHRPELAMVDSENGITNLNSPNDVIVDASMPAMIRNGGKMYGADGRLKEVKAVQPESTFARIYQEMINFCKWHGAFDPRTMGTVPNVGLMARKAEEYGSHDRTFEIPEDGTANVTDVETGEVLMSWELEEGDIWRTCLVKDDAIRDWVRLAVERARLSGMPVIFWLDPYRPHEKEIIKKVRKYLPDHDTEGLDIQIMSQVRAMRYTLERVMRGMDTISATGNILRDYLTDLFPILELGTSAKMLSIVPLMAGGGMYETGAGGTAPRHIQQLLEENHLRWDSLGEFLAVQVNLEDIARKYDNPRSGVLARTMDKAISKVLNTGKSPQRRTGQLDNRGSHFYLTLYWAQELATQSDDAELAAKFKPLAEDLAQAEEEIVTELNEVQGHKVDLGGYYLIDPDKLATVMQASKAFNTALAQLG